MMACRRSSLTIRKKFVSNSWQLKTIQNDYATTQASGLRDRDFPEGASDLA
jgi:hypothetical protein